MKKAVIIGAGAAGLMAAGKAAERGVDVHLYEKNDIVGKKIYITGKGRCNITNAGDIDDFMDNIPGNPYFLYSAFYNLDSSATARFFNSIGVPTKVERGKRVFPVSDKAADVAVALEKYARKNGAHIHTSCAVDGIITEKGAVTGVRLQNGKTISADSVIIATGGLSYPGTGSTGDGYKMAKKAGHTVTKLYPSLVPLKCSQGFCAELMGLSLKNTAIQIKDGRGKVVYKDFGEMLFTHYGVSGPMVLSASRSLLGRLEEGMKIIIDLKPALDEKTLDLRVLRDFEKYANKALKNALDDLLPQKLIPVIISLSGIDGDKKVHDIKREERKSLVSLIKGLTLDITGTTGYKEAVVTSGGVNVDEINPSTMESKLVKGLFFAGEVIDVDGYTGGFNLQIAFSTGYTAALNV